MDVVHSLQVEDKVSARSDVTELELSLCLLNGLETVFLEDRILFIKVSEYLNIEFVLSFLNLHLNERSCWEFPLKFIEFNTTSYFVESSFGVNDPSGGKNNEAWLSRSESVLF